MLGGARRRQNLDVLVKLLDIQVYFVCQDKHLLIEVVKTFE